MIIIYKIREDRVKPFTKALGFISLVEVIILAVISRALK